VLPGPSDAQRDLLDRAAARPPDREAIDPGGVVHRLWVEPGIPEDLAAAYAGQAVMIADGHHRYTTALQYQKEMEQQNGGKPLPEKHPANWCMFVLVGMQDDGLMILPTHRLIGGLGNFDPAAFKSAIAPAFDMVETPLGPDHVDEFIQNVLPSQPAHTFGLYDGRTQRVHQLTLKNPDVLRPLEPTHSDAWRRLDVAILQRYLLDEVIQPRFAGGKELTKGYTADPFEVAPKVDGSQYQVALLLRSTPLGALEQLAAHGEVMPQKSTFFFPKLATGMMMNPLR
jgi:uncharacterized protein (DUF1015 family)